MLKKNKYQILLFIALLSGVMILQSIFNDLKNSEIHKQEVELEKRNKETVLRIETGIDVYATVVSSIRAFVQNSPEFPSEKQLQHFIVDLTREIEFKDSLFVS